MVFVEGPDHGPGVPSCPGRIVARRRRLAGDRVHRSWRRRVRATLPRWLLGDLEPQREIPGLNASSQMPWNLHSVQEPMPGQQFVGVGPQRRWTGIVSKHVVQKLGDREHLHAPAVKKPERHQPVAGRLHLPDPGHVEPCYVPNLRAVLCHPCLRKSPWSMTRDHSRSRPRHAVTSETGPGRRPAGESRCVDIANYQGRSAASVNGTPAAVFCALTPHNSLAWKR